MRCEKLEDVLSCVHVAPKQRLDVEDIVPMLQYNGLQCYDSALTKDEMMGLKDVGIVK